MQHITLSLLVPSLLYHYFYKREPQQTASNHSSDIDFKDFMKFYKDYTKESYSFLVNDTALLSNNPLRFRKNLSKKEYQ